MVRRANVHQRRLRLYAGPSSCPNAHMCLASTSLSLVLGLVQYLDLLLCLPPRAGSFRLKQRRGCGGRVHVGAPRTHHAIRGRWIRQRVDCHVNPDTTRNRRLINGDDDDAAGRPCV
jgi:hypothetical protein